MRPLPVCWIILGLLSLWAVQSPLAEECSLAEPNGKPDDNPHFPDFTADLITPDIPHDVDKRFKETLDLTTSEGVGLVQRLYDIYSWQTFLAVNRLTDLDNHGSNVFPPEGKVAIPQWATWKESYEVYRPGGIRPESRGDLRRSQHLEPLPGYYLVPRSIDPNSVHIWLEKSLEKATHPHEKKRIQRGTDNLNRAIESASPIQMTQQIRELIRQGTIPDPYHKSTRVAFNLSAINDLFPQRRMLTVTDQAKPHSPLLDQNGRAVYYERLMNEAEFSYILDNHLYNVNGQVAFAARNRLLFPPGLYWDGEVRDTLHVGSIELKLAWKIISPSDDSERFFTVHAYVLDQADTWSLETMGLVGMHIAHSTFSSGNWVWSTFEQVDNLRAHGDVHPSFFDPDCHDCPVNAPPPPDSLFTGILLKTQVKRVRPIPLCQRELNRQVRKLLARRNSVWQHYQLISTQWSLKPGRDSWKAEPEHLANVAMETYIQEEATCMGCHMEATFPDTSRIPRAHRADVQIGWAKFSWLLREAHWNREEAPDSP